MGGHVRAGTSPGGTVIARKRTPRLYVVPAPLLMPRGNVDTRPSTCRSGTISYFGPSPSCETIASVPVSVLLRSHFREAVQSNPIGGAIAENALHRDGEFVVRVRGSVTHGRRSGRGDRTPERVEADGRERASRRRPVPSPGGPA